MRRYLFGKTILDIPDTHKVRDIHKQDPLYDRAFGFVLEAIARHSPDSVFVDVGANIGDTAATMANYVTNPIVCVEGGEDYLGFLRRNASLIGPQVSILERFVRSDALAGSRLRYSAGLGTGALELSGSGNNDGVADARFISVRDLLETAAARGRGVGLIKSDTDGFDGFLVLDYLRESDCPLFFECDTVNSLHGLPSPWPEVFRALSERRYSVVIYDNFGLPVCVVPDDPCAMLCDLAGYIHMQRCTQPVRLYYLDVWAFPRSAGALFAEVAEQVRTRFLHPYGF
jgi:FkbM family methyltransferase